MTGAAIPAHVPPERVFDFDPFASPLLSHDPHERVVTALRGAPDIFFTPHNGGHWMISRAALASEALADPVRFSSSPEYNPAGRRDAGLRLIPNQYDPPEHTAQRRVLNPPFAPGAIQRMRDSLRARAVALIEEVRPHGHCEFVGAIAKRFPIEIFIDLVKAPVEDTPLLLQIAETAVRGADKATRDGAPRDLAAYLERLIDDRAAEPGADLVSRIAQANIGDRPIRRDEAIAMGTLLFLGGLDTVAATLTFVMELLANRPDQYAKLVADPGRIPDAVEELLRIRGNAYMERGVTQDCEFHGVAFRREDRIVFLPALYGLDDQAVDRPFELDFDRPTAAHVAFGAGPHRCVGSHLARAELAIFLEEWIRLIGPFAIDTTVPQRTLGGIVWIHAALRLQWGKA